MCTLGVIMILLAQAVCNNNIEGVTKKIQRL